MPILAWSTMAGSLKAMPEMKIATVNPIPARSPMPKTCLHETPEGNWPNPIRTASHVMKRMPMGLPTSRAIATPTVTGLAIASDRVAAVKTTPAFASAKTGRMTKLTHG